MKITLLCPVCNEPLKDGFSAEGCYLVVGYAHDLEMECLNCGRLVNITVSAQVVDAEKPCELCGRIGYHGPLCLHAPCK